MAYREPVYLVISRWRVERMTKKPPHLDRNEIAVKLLVAVADTAFREPTMVHEIDVTDPLGGLNSSDIDFTQPFITEAEAEQIRQRRLEAAIEDLRARGYTVEPATEEQP